MEVRKSITVFILQGKDNVLVESSTIKVTYVLRQGVEVRKSITVFILQGKTKKAKKSKKKSVELPQTENIGVLCSWYTQSSSTANSTLIFSLACDGDSFFT